MSFFRPGPRRMPPGRAPGGVVFQVYSQRGHLLAERMLTPGVDADAAATRDAQIVADLGPRADVVWVAFDGDTGERWTTDEWRRFLGW